MTTPTWPDTLPQVPLRDGYARTPRDNVLRSQPDQGAPIQRTQFSAILYDVTASIVVTTAQLATFRTFYQENAGTPFMWKEWIADVDAKYIFGPTMPKTSVRASGKWRVDLTLVELPS